MSLFVAAVGIGIVLLVAAALALALRGAALAALPTAFRRPQLHAAIAVAGVAAIAWAFLVEVPAERARERQALSAELAGNQALVAEWEEMIDGLLVYIDEIKWEISEQTAVIERDGDRGAVAVNWLEEATFRLSRAESQLLGAEDGVVKYQVQIRDAAIRNAAIRSELRLLEE